MGPGGLTQSLDHRDGCRDLSELPSVRIGQVVVGSVGHPGRLEREESLFAPLGFVHGPLFGSLVVLSHTIRTSRQRW